MTRTNYNLIFILFLSLIGVYFYYFYDVTTRTYVSNPPQIKSRDVIFQFEMDGTDEQLLGRFRKIIGPPYGVYISFATDIPLQTITIQEIIVTSKFLDKKFTYLSQQDEAILLDFEQDGTTASASWSSDKTFPIPFNKSDYLTVNLIFETNIQGVHDSHLKEFILVPRDRRVKKLLTPEQAREMLRLR